MSTTMVSRPSYSSRQLARRLGIRRVVVGSRRTPFARTLINWGCAEIPDLRCGVTIFNRPESVKEAVDKRLTFRRFQAEGIPTVEFTESQAQANEWLSKNKSVFGRALTRSRGGKGIHLFLARKWDRPIPKLPLYTKFFKCNKELRVHVIHNKVVDFAEKRRIKTDHPPENRFWIRTHDNGWIYARHNAHLPEQVKNLSIRAVRLLGLDFGAVDIRIGDENDVRILEVNTAPGITGQTLKMYEQGFKDLLSGRI